jgi:hypothetical protein
VRIKLFGMLYHGVLVQNPLTRRLIAFAVKSLINRYRVYLSFRPGGQSAKDSK